MSKKVNITRDVESRRKIAQGQNKAAKVEKATTQQHDQNKEQTGAAAETTGTELPTNPPDKKPGRKTSGNP